MEWINIKERLPDSIKQLVVVYCPNGLYQDDCNMPSFHILTWYKTNFGDFHKYHILKITYWIPLLFPPNEP
jgi:hypothetical protein